MPIKRKTQLKNYTIIPNVGLEDPTLSAKAKGLLAYMLSKPDDWTFYQRELEQHFTDGKASIRSAMVDLVKHGYIVKGPRERNELGHLKEASWTVFDTPQPNSDYPTFDNRKQDGIPVNQQIQNDNAVKSTFSPNSDFPTFDFLTYGNRQLPITDLTNTLLKPINKNNKSEPQNQMTDQVQNRPETKYADPFTLWRTNTQFFKPSDQQQLLDWVSDFEELSISETEAIGIVGLAVQQSLDANAMNMAYVRTVLKGWLDSKVTSVELAKQAIEDRKAKRRQQSKPNQWQNANRGVPSTTDQYIEDLGW